MNNYSRLLNFIDVFKPQEKMLKNIGKQFYVLQAIIKVFSERSKSSQPELMTNVHSFQQINMKIVLLMSVRNDQYCPETVKLSYKTIIDV